MMRSIALVYSKSKPDAMEAAETTSKFLSKIGVVSYLTDVDSIFESSSITVADAIVIFGGDGTLLRCIHKLPECNVPILGVNFGRGGYLMDVNRENFLEAIKSVVDGSFWMDEVSMIAVYLDGEWIADALNEAYISNELAGKVIEFNIYYENVLMVSGVADALIASTPIGSTAYCLSAGGPAVDHDLDAVVIVPVCPLTRIFPFVVSLDKSIAIDVKSAKAQVLIDGCVKKLFGPGRVEIRRSKRRIRFIRINKVNGFIRRVKKRLDDRR